MLTASLFLYTDTFLTISRQRNLTAQTDMDVKSPSFKNILDTSYLAAGQVARKKSRARRSHAQLASHCCTTEHGTVLEQWLTCLNSGPALAMRLTRTEAGGYRSRLVPFMGHRPIGKSSNCGDLSYSQCRYIQTNTESKHTKLSVSQHIGLSRVTDVPTDWQEERKNTQI
jgi:hypothetical protein